MDIEKRGEEYVVNYAKTIIDACGARLPGSDEEAKAVPIIADFMKDATKNDVVVEPFKLAPCASIGAIPIFGVWGLIAVALSFLSSIASLILACFTLLAAILQVFTYTGALDFLFPKATSHNVYSTLEPPKGDAKYTILLGGHSDSSWCWNHALKNPKTMPLKVVTGIVGLVALIAVSSIRIHFGQLFLLSSNPTVLEIILFVAPVLFIPGFLLLIKYLSYNKAIASPGAMDNLTGCAYSTFVAKYFQENPDKHPDNCRIICSTLGAEEAGLKGSLAFCKKHKDDGMLDNLYFLNIDSIRDYDHFNVVKGDTWLFSKFDKDLINISQKAMEKHAGKAGVIANPVGGCDSTPFSRKGVKTVTLIAQNPIATNYYHTTNDTVDGLDRRTLQKFTSVIIDIVEDVAKYHESTK